MAAQIAFIGGGNMAACLIGGLLRAGHPHDKLAVAEPAEARAAWLAQTYAVRVSPQASQACTDAELVVLAVKPQQMRAAVTGLRLAPGCVVVSIAAGIQLASLRQWLGDDVHLVRTMPNTPALLGAGISGLYAEPGVPSAARALATYVLEAAGACVWLESESQIDAVTAVSGSGPAYFFLVTEAMREAGVKLGLSADVAGRLALQTLVGAARMAEDGAGKAIDIVQLRANVTSKGGTTEAAVGHLESAGLRTIFDEALRAAAERGKALGASLAGEN